MNGIPQITIEGKRQVGENEGTMTANGKRAARKAGLNIINANQRKRVKAECVALEVETGHHSHPYLSKELREPVKQIIVWTDYNGKEPVCKLIKQNLVASQQALGSGADDISDNIDY